MKKVICSFSKHFKRYIVDENFFTNNCQLSSISRVLAVVDSWGVDVENTSSLDELIYEGIDFEYMSKLRQLWIWCAFYIKKQEYKNFANIQEAIAYDDKYEEYYDKRWDEAPKVKISIDDWEVLQQKWKQIKTDKPQYVMFTLDDSESVDKIEIFGKNELSQQDLQDMQIEHEKYLKYKQARQKYINNHPDYSTVWRGPQDDEYEADIMQYYET